MPTKSSVGSAFTITDGFERIQPDDKVGVCLTYFNLRFTSRGPAAISRVKPRKRVIHAHLIPSIFQKNAAESLAPLFFRRK